MHFANPGESVNIARLNQQMQGETSFALRVVGDGDFTHLMQTLFREGQCIFTSLSCSLIGVSLTSPQKASHTTRIGGACFRPRHTFGTDGRRTHGARGMTLLPAAPTG
jgi:hypothetical protein